MNSLRKFIKENQILAIFIVVAGIWLISQLYQILLILFIAILLTVALWPAVNYFKKKGLPNLFAVLLPYLMIIAVITLIVSQLAPVVGKQASSFVEDFSEHIDEVTTLLNLEWDQESPGEFIFERLEGITQNLFVFTGQLFNFMVGVLSVIFLSLYMLLDYQKLRQSIPNLFGRYRETAQKAIDRVERDLGRWVRGQIVIAIIVGILVGIALSIIGVEFALALALIALVLELIPFIGPILASIPAIIIGLGTSVGTAIMVALAFIVIQQIESSILSPNIMKRAVGLHPVVVILSVIVGVASVGLVGALIAVPLVAFFKVIIQTIQEDRKLATNKN